MSDTIAKLGEHPAVQLTEKRLQQHIDRRLPNARVWLFGSRARGDALRRSDFDLAFEPSSGFDPKTIYDLEDAIEKDPEIIYTVDLVNLSEASDEMRRRVREEGILWKN